jgi:hypothetical protein
MLRYCRQRGADTQGDGGGEINTHVADGWSSPVARQVKPHSRIDGWLRGIGLPQYAEMFRANDIDVDLLSRLSNDDLKEIGVGSFGHRRKLLEAIAELAGAFPVSPQLAIEPKRHDAAERRQVTVLFSDFGWLDGALCPHGP